MKMRFLVSSALFLFAVSPALYPQSSTGDSSLDAQQRDTSLDAQQNSSPNCADAQPGMSDSCEQSQQQGQREMPGAGNPSKYSAVCIGTDCVSAVGEYASRQQKWHPAAGAAVAAGTPPTEFQKFVAATTGQLLPIYGVNLFRNVPSTFSPSNLAPATSGYVIGPDDELRVRIWGCDQLQWEPARRPVRQYFSSPGWNGACGGAELFGIGSASASSRRQDVPQFRSFRRRGADSIDADLCHRTRAASRGLHSQFPQFAG